MPLLDHFHAPLKDLPPWEAISTMWAASLARWLNRTLPQGEFIAYPTIHLGTQVEADVAEYEKRANGASVDGPVGNVATLPEAPPALLTLPVTFPDDLEIRVGTSRHELNLCGVIELVSQGNKKEPDERDAFVAKCLAYLSRGIGIVVIDVVTDRLANLHNLLVRRLGGKQQQLLLDDPPTYVASYRPVHRSHRNELDIWPYPAAIGSSLPEAPFALKRGPTIMLDLEATYLEATHDLGL